jgi:hypothetical protein
VSDFRDKLGRDLDAEYETFVTFLKEAMQAKRKVWHSCPKCKTRSEVEIMDVKAGLQAAQLWANEGHGKAPQSTAKQLEPLDPEDTDVASWSPEKRKQKKAQLIALLNAKQGQSTDQAGYDLSVDSAL